MRTGNNKTPVIITKRGTQGRTKLPLNTAVKKLARFVSNWAVKGSQQWEKTTKKQAKIRNKSIHPIVSLFSIIQMQQHAVCVDCHLIWAWFCLQRKSTLICTDLNCHKLNLRIYLNIDTSPGEHPSARLSLLPYRIFIRITIPKTFFLLDSHWGIAYTTLCNKMLGLKDIFPLTWYPRIAPQQSCSRNSISIYNKEERLIISYVDSR